MRERRAPSLGYVFRAFARLMSSAFRTDFFFSSQVKDSRLLFGREGGYLTGGYFREEWGGHERGRSY